jgi:NTP pyrophosphatase (non-canonical NTP hydrolase)
MSRSMTFKQAQEEVRNFIESKGKDWTRIDNHFYLFTHLGEEMGELARDVINSYFRWTNRQTREPVPKQEITSQIEDDLGDILYHLFKLAIAYEIDLGDAFRKALSEIREKYGRG